MVLNLYFNVESKQSYLENNTIKDDYIDIKVQESGLSNLWGTNNNQQAIHLAIECKVIENGYSEYVSDIKKMCIRPYLTPRLIYEGQIAFITNKVYNHQSVKDGINRNLAKNIEINTIQDLIHKAIYENFNASYLSVHKRSHNSQNFTIYHLFLNYSEIVTE